MSPEARAVVRTLRLSSSPRAGVTLMEALVGMLLLGVIGAVFASIYRNLDRSAGKISEDVELQSLVKGLDQELHADLDRAGFGLEGSPVFGYMETKRVRIFYRDLIGSYCSEGQLAGVYYGQANGGISRSVTCDGVDVQRRSTGANRDSLDISFRYLDNKGMATADPGLVRNVEYTLSANSLRHNYAKSRVIKGNVNLVNN